MSASTLRVVRQTALGDHQRHVRFLQIDNDIADLLTSREATRISTCIYSVYTRMKLALRRYQSQPGVLRVEGVERGGEYLTPWEHLKEITQVSDATLSKCLDFLERNGVIGRRSHYRNGLPIFIWFNHAATSVVSSTPSLTGQKNLRLVNTSDAKADTSSSEASFNGTNEPRQIQNHRYAPPNGGAPEVVAVVNAQTSITPTPTNNPAETNFSEQFRPVSSGTEEPVPQELIRLVSSVVTKAISESLNATATALARQTTAAVRESREEVLRAVWGASEVLHTHIEKSAAKAGRVGSAEAFKLAQQQGWLRKSSANTRVGGESPPAPVPSQAAPQALPDDRLNAAIEYGSTLSRLQPSVPPEELLSRLTAGIEFKLTAEDRRRLLRAIQAARTEQTQVSTESSGKEAEHVERIC